MTDIQTLRQQRDLDAMIKASADRPVVLFKHSVACPISARAQEQFVKLTSGDTPLYALVVQYVQALSDAITAMTDVPHETPQLMVLHQGKAVRTFNHREIDAAVVCDAVETVD